MSIASKIAKLLRLAESGNPHEAALAAARAQELMIRHCVSQAEVRAAGGQVEAEPVELEPFMYENGRVPQWHKHLANAMGRSFMVRVFFGWRSIIVVGGKTQREVFRATWQFVRDEIARLATEGWASLTPRRRSLGDHARWKKGFCFGACDTVEIRLLQAERRLVASSDSGTTAIVLADKLKEADAWVKENIPKVTGVSFTRPESGHADGVRAGWSVNLDKRAPARHRLPGAGQRAGVGG